MKNVLSSVAEAEIASCFHNAQEALAFRTTLQTLGHPQPPTPIQTDNSTAQGILTDTVKQKRSKAIDMRYYWLRDRVRQQQFYIHWQPGYTNHADYFTKHHPPSTHTTVRSHYLLHSVGPSEGVLKSCLSTNRPQAISRAEYGTSMRYPTSATVLRPYKTSSQDVSKPLCSNNNNHSRQETETSNSLTIY
jgi:hypothetical protein